MGFLSDRRERKELNGVHAEIHAKAGGFSETWRFLRMGGAPLAHYWHWEKEPPLEALREHVAEDLREMNPHDG